MGCLTIFQVHSRVASKTTRRYVSVSTVAQGTNYSLITPAFVPIARVEYILAITPAQLDSKPQLRIEFQLHQHTGKMSNNQNQYATDFHFRFASFVQRISELRECSPGHSYGLFHLSYPSISGMNRPLQLQYMDVLSSYASLHLRGPCFKHN